MGQGGGQDVAVGEPVGRRPQESADISNIGSHNGIIVEVAIIRIVRIAILVIVTVIIIAIITVIKGPENPTCVV